MWTPLALSRVPPHRAETSPISTAAWGGGWREACLISCRLDRDCCRACELVCSSSSSKEGGLPGTAIMSGIPSLGGAGRSSSKHPLRPHLLAPMQGPCMLATAPPPSRASPRQARTGARPRPHLTDLQAGKARLRGVGAPERGCRLSTHTRTHTHTTTWRTWRARLSTCDPGRVAD